MDTLTIPLFPLKTVLFPHGILPLRLFEPRYLDMVSGCMKSGTGFGVCLISAGEEVGPAASIHTVGTLAKIADWEMHEDGLLGITLCGQERLTVLSQHVESNQLIMATASTIPAEAETEIPPAYCVLVELLRKTLEQSGYPYTDRVNKYDEAGWVGCRLAEFLPFKLSFKQELLELNDPLQRLQRIAVALEELAAQKPETL